MCTVANKLLFQSDSPSRFLEGVADVDLNSNSLLFATHRANNLYFICSALDSASAHSNYTVVVTAVPSLTAHQRSFTRKQLLLSTMSLWWFKTMTTLHVLALRLSLENRTNNVFPQFISIMMIRYIAGYVHTLDSVSPAWFWCGYTISAESTIMTLHFSSFLLSPSGSSVICLLLISLHHHDSRAVFIKV